MEKTQAERILSILEKLPEGACVDITRMANGEWQVEHYMTRSGGRTYAEHYGVSLIDALSQLAMKIGLDNEGPQE